MEEDTAGPGLSVIELIRAGFPAAEEAAEEAVEAILEAGGLRLYDAYIERKSFPFASGATVEAVQQELRMCFVRHDAGESGDPDDIDDWKLEPEPARCRIDTWARACVPVRKKIVRLSDKLDDEGGKRKIRATNRALPGIKSDMTKSAAGFTGEVDPKATGGARSQMVPIVEDRVEDEEETLLREMKDREARRQRDDQARVQRKANEEADEAARLAMHKDQMKNRPYTYDSTGNVIWIQAPQVESLPSTNPAPNFTLKKVASKEDQKESDEKKKGGTAKKAAVKRRPKKEPEFADGFKPLSSKQPSMVDVMNMSNGVVLTQGQRSKRGQDLEKSRDAMMTRKDYEQMVASTGKKPSADADALLGTSLDLVGSRDADLAEASFVSAGPSDMIPGLGTVGISESDAFNLAIVQSQDWGRNPGPPGEPRPLPMAPPGVHSMKMKRDALGYAMSTRDRIQREGAPTHGMRAHAPQPMIGATMGHGLLPSSDKKSEFYFPLAPPDEAEEASIETPKTSARASDKKKQGQIHNPDPALTRRIFTQGRA